MLQIDYCCNYYCFNYTIITMDYMPHTTECIEIKIGIKT